MLSKFQEKTEVKPMNHGSVVIGKSLLCTQQKWLHTGNPQTKTWDEAQGSLYSEKQWLFVTVIGYNIRIFLNIRELTSVYIIPVLRNNLSFTCDFQKHMQEGALTSLAE